ncbi:MFS transporter [Brevundimonas lenta]|uniref:MFS family permease n=1 Tax=Brevundimonas lenta TaxID=424796 RepID=A0A7W6NPI0_9CAUL|nr:MFS transporter [Brevundimonas lenta]MBB4082172.1 MFS family permease [Brevundimonas lenta]
MSLRNISIVAVLGLGQIVAFASSYYLLGVLADPMALSFGVPPAAVFMALSAALLISAVMTPPTGRMIERFGARAVLMVSNGLFAAALVVMAAAPGPWVLYLGIAGLGVGMATGLYGTAFAALVELHGAAARRPITAVSLLGALGGGLGWPVSRWIIQQGDWRMACLVWALAHLLLCLPLAIAVLPRRRAAPAAADAPVAKVAWDGRMIRMAAYFAGAWAVATALGAHLPRLLGDLGLGAEQAAWAAGLMAASAVAARVIDLVFLHRSHPVATARLATLFHPLGALVAGLGGPRLAAAVAVGQGAGNGLMSVASGVLPLHVFGPDRYAVRQSMILTPARYVQAAAPAVYALALGVSPAVAMTLTSLVCLAMFAFTLGLQPAQRPVKSAGRFSSTADTPSA